MPSYKITITGNDIAKSTQRISLVITRPSDSTFVVQEAHAEHSTFSGNKPIGDAARRLTFNSPAAVAAYPQALGIIQWDAEITDEEGNYVKKISANDKDFNNSWDRLQALITAWSALTACEWA